ncbi:MAG TPA: peptide deformylase [Patescibacteria group bacterium]
MIRKIVDVKNPVLREKSKEVKKIDKKIKELVGDMMETLEVQEDPEGVGLAAPQVGRDLRIFVMDYSGKKRVVINPCVLEVSEGLKAKPKTKAKNGKKKKDRNILEGCLSLPNYYGPIKRPQRIKISYMDLNGKKQVEEFNGFFAQIVQHEMDHLNGVLFIDRILEQKSPLYKFEGDEWEEVELI